MKNFAASTVIKTNIGNLKGNVALNSVSGPSSKAIRWKAEVIVEEFNVGSLLNDPATFGPVSLKASADGTGLKKDDVEAQLNVQVEKAVLNGYPYRGLLVQWNCRSENVRREGRDSGFQHCLYIQRHNQYK